MANSRSPQAQKFANSLKVQNGQWKGSSPGKSTSKTKNNSNSNRRSPQAQKFANSLKVNVNPSKGAKRMQSSSNGNSNKGSAPARGRSLGGGRGQER